LGSCSFSNDFDQDALAPPAIEFAVKDLLPRAKVQLAIRDGDDHFAPHDLTFEVGIAVIFACTVVAIAAERLVRSKPFQPFLVILVKARFIIVDENRGRNVHGIYQDKPLTNATFTEAFFYLRGDVDESPPCGHVKPEFFAVAFHSLSLESDSSPFPLMGIVGLGRSKCLEKKVLHLLLGILDIWMPNEVELLERVLFQVKEEVTSAAAAPGIFIAGSAYHICVGPKGMDLAENERTVLLCLAL